MSMITSNLAESFFANRARKRTTRPQLLIATLTGIMFSLDMIAVYMNLGQSQPTYGGTVLVLGLLYFLIPFMIWVFMTITTYIISRLMNARAELTHIWRTFGWGLAPLSLSGLLLGVGRYLTLPGPCNILNCDVSQYVRLLPQVEDVYVYLGATLGTTTFQVLFAASILCFLIADYLWIAATYKSTTLTRTGAIIAAGIPALILNGIYLLSIF